MRALPVLLLAGLATRADDGAAPRWVADDELHDAIGRAVARGVAHLLRVQRGDGSWSYETVPARRRAGRLDPIPRGGRFRPDGRDGGLTAVALHALAAAGVPRDDDGVRRAIAWIRHHGTHFDHTNDAGTLACSHLVRALARLDAAHFGPEIRTLAGRIAASQHASGMWAPRLSRPGRGAAFPRPRESGGEADNASTESAVLALWAAHSLAGWRAPQGLWKRVERHFRGSQHADGTWGARPGPHRTGDAARMTAAGIAGWVYARAAMDKDDTTLPRVRAAPVARRGLAAFREATDPLTGGDYALFRSVERVGTVLGLRDLAWYEALARRLVRAQDGRGFWKGRTPGADAKHAYETALVLLVLGRATLPPRKGALAAPGGIDALTVRDRLAELPRAKTHRRAFEIFLSLDADARAAQVRTLGARGPGFVDHLLAVLELDRRAGARRAAHALLETLLGKRLLYASDAVAAERAVMARGLKSAWIRVRDDVRWDGTAGRYR